MPSPKPKDQAGARIARFRRRDGAVAGIGLGYVGLPTVRAFHDAGFRVIGYDIDAAKIESLHAGKAYIKHLGEDWLAALARSGRFTPTAAPALLAKADAIVLCAPPPLRADRDPDL